MRNYADEVNIHARIYAMRSRLLSLRDYTLMLRDQETSSGKITGETDTTEAAETIFKEQIAPVINIAGACDRYKMIFLAYLRLYEVQNVKLLLAKASGRQSVEQWYDIGPFAILDKDVLEKNLSIDELQSLLTGTYLEDDFRVLSRYRRMAILLDIVAFRNLYDVSASLSRQARTDFQEIILKRIAVLSVIWSHRLRVSYRLGEEKIRRYLTQIYDRLGIDAWPQVKAVEEDLSRHLEPLRKGGGQEPSVADIERHLEQSFYIWIASAFHRDFHSIFCVVSYLWLLHYQIRNLLGIVEGRRFGFSTDAILSKLICEA